VFIEASGVANSIWSDIAGNIWSGDAGGIYFIAI